MNSLPVFRRLTLDVALWYVMPALFLACYVGVFSEPATAVVPHLLALATPLSAILLTRLLISRFVADEQRNRLISSFLISIPLALIVTYYCFVLIGLSSWGGVVAWDVIPTFISQRQVAADLLHLPVPLLVAALLLIFFGMTRAVWLYLRRFDWTLAVIARVSDRALVGIIAAGTASLAIYAVDFAFGYATQLSEPISLTLFPHMEPLALEGYTANPIDASLADNAQDAARRAYVPSASPVKGNVIVIVVDGLRPDHMGLYGYGRDTTPNLARIATEAPSRVIAGTHASCGDTACAMFSLFSSKFPNEFSFHPFFLHEALRRNGYHTHLILSGDHTHFFGLKRFYGDVDSFYDGNQSDGGYLNDDRQVLDQVSLFPKWDGAPVMFQFHLMSAHILRNAGAEPAHFQPAVRYSSGVSHDIGPGGAPAQEAVNFYDNGVLEADNVINALLTALQTKGYLGNSVVVITADHGESLGEHGLFKHANSVREELLRVPLVFLYYGMEPRIPAVPRQSPSQIDIAPTILGELGLPIPASWRGWPLQRSGGPDFSFFQEHAFAGLIDHRDTARIWKYWIDRNSGQDHVYELNGDADEDHDLRAELPPERLEEWRARTRAETSSGLAVR